MTVTIGARHTQIVERIPTQHGTLVREDYFQYPTDESNLYMVDSEGKVKWFAERAMEGDAYANSIYELSGISFKCASWNGYNCEIDLKSGKLIHAVFTK